MSKDNFSGLTARADAFDGSGGGLPASKLRVMSLFMRAVGLPSIHECCKFIVDEPLEPSKTAKKTVKRTSPMMPDSPLSKITHCTGLSQNLLCSSPCHKSLLNASLPEGILALDGLLSSRQMTKADFSMASSDLELFSDLEDNRFLRAPVQRSRLTLRHIWVKSDKWC